MGDLALEPLRKYNYAELPPRAIRILELQPGASAKSSLSCRVVVQDIQGKSYEALSYVWGDPTPTAFVNCTDDTDVDNHGVVGVGVNLDKVLRAFWPAGDQPRRIWIDAICINQGDLDERQSQVRMMGHVFGNAERVLCWLGAFNPPLVDEATGRLAVDFIKKFNANPDKELRLAHQHFHFGEEGDGEYDENGIIPRTWRAIKAMFDIEYFHRVWIIQEVGLAQIARLFWGNEGTWIDWTEVALFCKVMDASGASLVSHLDLKSWVCNHINLVWQMKEDGRPLFNFVEVLHWARIHRCADPRDYVYALLSHPSATVDGTALIRPDYTKSAVQAYTDLAVNVINRTRSLHILAFVDHDGDPKSGTLPSWVPDWHAVNLVAPLRTPTHAAPLETDGSHSIYKSAAGTVLRCSAIVVDSVRAMSDMINHTQLTVSTLAREEQKKTPFLIDHIWKRIVTDPEIPLTSGVQFVGALASVLSGGYCQNVATTSEGPLKQQLADCAAFILEFKRIRPAGASSPDFLASLEPEERTNIERMAADGSPVRFIQDITWNAMCRKVFRTTKGHIGLGPRTMQEGDVCAVLRGSVYPIIFRRRDDNILLVGPAWLYGFMAGEAEQLHQKGELTQLELEII